MLYLVATPIGNLKDISQRALEILGECDVIACEDTRRTVKLLNAYDIKKKLISYHKHNERETGEKLLGIARDGMDICLVSDAGCPGISDPGEQLVKLFYDNGMEVSVIPGPNAALSALVLSGLETGKFVFEGFLPSTSKKRMERLKEIADEQRTLIFYEAPHRLSKCLADMVKAFGSERKAAVVKEITKIYEKVTRGTLSDLAEAFSGEGQKGEHVLVVEGGKAPLPDVPEKSIEESYGTLISEGVDRKEAMRIIARQYNISRREVYSRINKDN